MYHRPRTVLELVCSLATLCEFLYKHCFINYIKYKNRKTKNKTKEEPVVCQTVVIFSIFWPVDSSFTFLTYTLVEDLVAVRRGIKENQSVKEMWTGVFSVVE